MSFREFLKMNGHGDFTTIHLGDIGSDHLRYSREITGKIRPLPLFKEYLRFGYFPFYQSGSEKEYLIKILQVINTILDNDLSIVESFNAGTARKIKKLLGVLSESAPFKPNIAGLARKLDASRDSVYEWLILLQRARLINQLIAEGKSSATLRKPEKIFLENTNLSYALKSSPEAGNLRETFLLNQLINAGVEVFAPIQGDFVTSDYTIEVGGKNKAASDLGSNYIVASDDIENGYRNKLPLWLFGFLY